MSEQSVLYALVDYDRLPKVLEFRVWQILAGNNSLGINHIRRFAVGEWNCLHLDPLLGLYLDTLYIGFIYNSSVYVGATCRVMVVTRVSAGTLCVVMLSLGAPLTPPISFFWSSVNRGPKRSTVQVKPSPVRMFGKL